MICLQNYRQIGSLSSDSGRFLVESDKEGSPNRFCLRHTALAFEESFSAELYLSVSQVHVIYFCFGRKDYLISFRWD